MFDITIDLIKSRRIHAGPNMHKIIFRKKES